MSTPQPRLGISTGHWLINSNTPQFGIIERQAIHRGTFGSVRELTAAIRAFINGWNRRSHPFVWTKTADETLKKSKSSKTSNTSQ